MRTVLNTNVFILINRIAEDMDMTLSLTKDTCSLELEQLERQIGLHNEKVGWDGWDVWMCMWMWMG